MRIENLKKRIETIEAAAGREAIILEDGTKWVPRVPLLNIFVELLEYSASTQQGQTPGPLSPEVLEDVKMWAKRRPLLREQGILFTGIAAMAKEFVDVENEI